MKLEVSKKDLLLIKAAVTLLIVIACVRFLVMPALEDVQTSRTEMETMETQTEEWQYEIDSISSLETQRDALTAQLSELAAPYYGSMETQEIDELVTGIALEHSLFPVNLSIGDTATEVPAAYLYSEAVLQAAAQEETETTEDADSTEDTDTSGEETVTTTAGYLTQHAVSFTMQGSEENVLAFLNDLDQNYPSIQVKNFTMSSGDYLSTQLEQISVTTLNCSLVVFTCDEQ